MIPVAITRANEPGKSVSICRVIQASAVARGFPGTGGPKKERLLGATAGLTGMRSPDIATA
jgi:hypothetical protein